jgi:hypothetical protein
LGTNNKLLRVSSHTFANRVGASRVWSWLAALLDWRPAALMGVCAALLVLCSQAPLRYDFEIGRSGGPESDLPFMQGFHPAEPFEDRQSFRWSKAQEASIVLPGIGRRGTIVGLDIVSHRAQWDKAAPPTMVRCAWLCARMSGISPTTAAMNWAWRWAGG